MRILCSIFGACLFLAVATYIPKVGAQEDISPEALTIIRQNCVSAQVALQQVQYNDAATRVNRGQGYESLLSRLIIPFNTRVTSNGYNDSAANLTTTTNKYQTALSNFKKHYDSYDDAVTDALHVKCQEKPADFYHSLVEARKQRSNIANDVASLSQLIEEYRQGAVKLKGEVKGDVQ